MGRVHAATGPDCLRAAIKVICDDLADDTGFRRRFRREVAAASAVVGLFTARVLDADPNGEPPWLATEFVEGPSLRDAVLTHGPMPEHALLDLARGLAEALAAIHAAGLVHRDLKPANVLLSPAGPRVIDFGIARAVDASRLTVTGQIIGTPDFMAPEQIEGTRESGPEGDVFALGSTLAWAATSRGPFAADQTAATLYRIMAMPPDLRGVPPRVAAIVEACLAKEPAARPTAVRLAVQLRGANADPRGGATVTLLPGTPPSAPPTASPSHAHPTLPPVRSPSRRRARLVGTGVLAAVVAGTVTAVTLSAAATPAPGPQPTPPVVTTAAAPVSADSPQTRYDDRLCASGTLLSALGSTAISPAPGSDPVQLKRDFLAVADRTIGTPWKPRSPTSPCCATRPRTTRSRPSSGSSSRSSPRPATRSPRGARRWRPPSRSPSRPTGPPWTATLTAHAAWRSRRPW
jgi:serine/threonine protein kinase